jgi:hypothetical protein
MSIKITTAAMSLLLGACAVASLNAQTSMTSAFIQIKQGGIF